MGTHDVTAIYSGDSLFVSSSATLTQRVIRNQTDTYLDSSLDPSSNGQAVTFTATVQSRARNGGTPVGSVSFLDGTTVLSTTALDDTGTATFTTSSLSTGNHLITAIYVGNGNFVGSSEGLIQSVGSYGTATTITDVEAPPSEQGMILTAIVTASSGTPTRTVTFLDGTSVLGRATLNSSGVATLQASPTPGHIVTAIYTVDSTHTGSSWYFLVPISGSQTSTTVLSSSASPAWASQPVTFTATVSGSYGTPTGSVTFYDGTTVRGTASLDASGIATFTTSTLPLDSHDIVAIPSGDAVYESSTSSLILAVVQAASTTSLSSSANPSPSGQAVTFTATVATVEPSAGTPTGTVDFYDGTTFLGTGTLTLVNGQLQATFTTSELEPGKHDIIAIYSGDNTFADSESTLEETINS